MVVSVPMDIPLVVTTLPGLEGVLSEELKELGAQGVEGGSRAVLCQGNLSTIYLLNLSLRTGLRVLWRVSQTTVTNKEDLYRVVTQFPWETFIHPHQTLSVTFSSSGAGWISPRYAPLVVKDAVVDRFRKLFGKRPTVNTRSPDLGIHLHLEGNFASLSVDTSGESLFRRGYRTEHTEAPLSEVLAAGILRLMGWKPGIPLYDPMCGSGTFLVEAGLVAAGSLPRLGPFPFQQWKNYHPTLFEQARDRALQKALSNSISKIPPKPDGAPGRSSSSNGESPLKIYGSDRDPEAIRVAKRNLERAGLRGQVVVHTAEFGAFIPPRFLEEGGWIVMNPPYGVRLVPELSGKPGKRHAPVTPPHASKRNSPPPSLEEFYQHIGDTLKQRYPGTQAWVLSGNPEGTRRIGLRPFKKRALKNGPLDCKLLGFRIVTGAYLRGTTRN